jgi:hypothetical protein
MLWTQPRNQCGLVVSWLAGLVVPEEEFLAGILCGFAVHGDPSNI